MRAELAALNKSLISWLEYEKRTTRRAAWIEARRADQKSFRLGPPVGFLVGGALPLLTGASVLAFDVDFLPVGAPLVVVGGLLVVTGVVTLTRVLRKRRAIEREIEDALRRPIPSPRFTFELAAR